ncbi:MAG: THUMP domain-containing protein, partial [Candidatus Aenigmatarchaeota archaeon]
MKSIEELDQMLVLRTDADPHKLSRRLGLCHWIGEHFATTEVDDIYEAIGSSDMVDYLPQSESIAVRGRRIKNSLQDVDLQEVSEEIGSILLEKHDYEVDLENPDNEVLVVFTEEKCLVSIIRARVDRSEFRERSPQERESVHPSTMKPSFARALVNLARTPRFGTFLDPF